VEGSSRTFVPFAPVRPRLPPQVFWSHHGLHMNGCAYLQEQRFCNSRHAEKQAMEERQPTQLVWPSCTLFLTCYLTQGGNLCTILTNVK
jgi:hypothetical protein